MRKEARAKRKKQAEKASSADLRQVLRLLRENGLPTAGVKELLPNLLIIREGRRIIGCAGLEVYGQTGLLRSVAVSQDRRNKGNGTLLTKAVLELAREKQVRRLFLLTTAASGFFRKLGFKEVERKAVSPAIKNSLEFSSLCPESTIAMVASLE